MKMPIVSLTAMAMNESVAATCCYKATNINGNNYETVLSGGSVIVDVQNKYTYGCKAGWTTVAGDYEEATIAPLVTNAAGELGYYVDDKFTKLSSLTAIGSTASIYDGGFAADLTKCDHKGAYCTYVQNGTLEPIFVKTHVGATVEHAASKNWAAAHTAVRFNS